MEFNISLKEDREQLLGVYYPRKETINIYCTNIWKRVFNIKQFVNMFHKVISHEYAHHFSTIEDSNKISSKGTRLFLPSCFVLLWGFILRNIVLVVISGIGIIGTLFYEKRSLELSIESDHEEFCDKFAGIK